MPGRTSRLTGQVYIANDSFVAKDGNGNDRSYMQGLTRVTEGDPMHPVLEAAPHLFDLLEDRMVQQQA